MQTLYIFLAARSRGEQCWQGGDGGEDTTQGEDQTIWVWWKIPFSVCDIYSSDTTAMNPQFHIQIPRSGAAKCHVVVSLTLTILIKRFLFVLWNRIHLRQIISRKSHYLVQVSVTQQYETNVSNNKKKRTLHHIGFAVYEVPPNMTRLSPQYVLEHVSLALCIFIYRFYPCLSTYNVLCYRSLWMWLITRWPGRWLRSSHCPQGNTLSCLKLM